MGLCARRDIARPILAKGALGFGGRGVSRGFEDGGIAPCPWGEEGSPKGCVRVVFSLGFT